MELSREVVVEVLDLFLRHCKSGKAVNEFIKTVKQSGTSKPVWKMFKQFKRYENFLLYLTKRYWQFHGKLPRRKDDIMFMLYLLIFKFKSEDYNTDTVISTLSLFRTLDYLNILRYLCSKRFKREIYEVCILFFSMSYTSNIIRSLKSKAEVLRDFGNKLSCKLWEVTDEDKKKPAIECYNVWNGIGEGDWIISKEVIVTTESTEEDIPVEN